MRGTPFEERLSVVNLVKVLEVSTLKTLGEILVSTYGRKSEKNGKFFSKMRASP